MIVRVPASTANLGPAFDALGMALSLHAEIGVVDDPATAASRGRTIDEHHPASVAFRAAGGRGQLWVRSPIPIGRGLGFSGAMRVGGAAAALADGGDLEDTARDDVFALAARLEGHADNVAASVYGGVVATDGTRAVRVTTSLDPDVVVWVPAATTATTSSRARLPDRVALGDAAFNLGRVAVLVATLTAGDVSNLRHATEDRLHQERRFATAPGSREALAAGLDAGAWCGWLSGSGPAVALLTGRGDGDRLAAGLPGDGHVKVLSIDRHGVQVVGPVADGASAGPTGVP